MKKFKFSLDAVLKWKRSHQEAALKLMGEAMRRRQLAVEAVQNARRALGALLTAMREARETAQLISPWAQAAYIREVARLEAVCRHQEEQLQHLTKEEEKARQAYLSRRREAETIEKLKEKRREAYEKEVTRVLDLELEEIVLSRHVKELYASAD